MAAETVTTRVASFELSLENTEDSTDTTRRTISFDVPASTDQASIEAAAQLFTASSLSTAFQPANWRDYGGNWDVYKLTAVKPSLTEKTVVTYDQITPA